MLALYSVSQGPDYERHAQQLIWDSSHDRVYRRGLSRPDLSIEELKQQKAEFFIMEVFPVSLANPATKCTC